MFHHEEITHPLPMLSTNQASIWLSYPSANSENDLPTIEAKIKKQNIAISYATLAQALQSHHQAIDYCFIEWEPTKQCIISMINPIAKTSINFLSLPYLRIAANYLDEKFNAYHHYLNLKTQNLEQSMAPFTNPNSNHPIDIDDNNEVSRKHTMLDLEMKYLLKLGELKQNIIKLKLYNQNNANYQAIDQALKMLYCTIMQLHTEYGYFNHHLPAKTCIEPMVDTLNDALKNKKHFSNHDAFHLAEKLEKAAQPTHPIMQFFKGVLIGALYGLAMAGLILLIATGIAGIPSTLAMLGLIIGAPSALASVGGFFHLAAGKSAKHEYHQFHQPTVNEITKPLRQLP